MRLRRLRRQATAKSPTLRGHMAPRGTLPLCRWSWLHLLCPSAHLPSALLLPQQRRDAAGNGLDTSLGTTIKNVRTC
jgi:hypothetical protein